MGFMRRVRKSLQEGQGQDPEPVYLFYPDKEKAGDIVHAILQNVPFDINVKIVTDDKLCKRIGEGITNAIATKQHSVMEGSKEKGLIILPEDFRK